MQRKISIVTPVYNGEQYIEKCILSVKNQNYSNYEHIIVDGGSTDNTLAIIKKYENEYPVKIISEKDEGMYDAIAKGFSVATGEIFAWLNSDDVYLPWAFQVMNYTVSQGVNWATCINAHQNENDVFYHVASAFYYPQKWIQKGYYDNRLLKFIQQESTFWTRDLWQKTDAQGLIRKYNFAGDYALWRKFAETEKLYTVKTVIASFRIHNCQKSSDIESYYSETKTENPSLIKKVFIRICNLIYCGVFPFLFKNLVNRIDLDVSVK